MIIIDITIIILFYIQYMIIIINNGNFTLYIMILQYIIAEIKGTPY